MQQKEAMEMDIKERMKRIKYGIKENTKWKHGIPERTFGIKERIEQKKKKKKQKKKKNSVSKIEKKKRKQKKNAMIKRAKKYQTAIGINKEEQIKNGKRNLKT